MRSDTVRAGASLIETLAVLTLTSLLVALVVGVCIAQLRLARVTAERAVDSDALRTASGVLSGEARRMTRADVRALSGDSIGVRAFRGAGIICGITPAGVFVRYTGDRLPEVLKDSILVIASGGTGTVTLIEARPAAGSCDARQREDVMEWRVSGSAPPAGVLLVFESGSYHLSDRALRYRIGAAGRQPLSAEALRHPDSRFTDVDDAAIRFELGAGDRHPTRHTAYFALPGSPP